jgi:hypothetical protein
VRISWKGKVLDTRKGWPVASIKTNLETTVWNVGESKLLLLINLSRQKIS